MMMRNIDVHGAIKRVLVKGWPYPLLFATGGGSRAFGYPSVESDYDIHGVHLLPLDHVLSVTPPDPFDTVSRKYGPTSEHPLLEVKTYDLKKFRDMLVKGNGNILESLFSPQVIVTTEQHEELKDIAQGCITKRIGRHYLEYAYNQDRKFKRDPVKLLLHMYRCLLMGHFLMHTSHVKRTGYMELDLNYLALLYGYEDTLQELLKRKIFSHSEILPPLSEREMRNHQAILYSLRSQLEHAITTSALPDETSDATRHRLTQFLITTRKKGMEGRRYD